MNMKRTYLNGSIKNGNVMRWSINPLVVYIAPMKFYSKPGIVKREEKKQNIIIS